MLNRLWWAILTLVVLGLLLLSGPYVLSAYYLEKGGTQLAQGNSRPGALRTAIEDLERAVALDGRNVQARRQLAHAYLTLAQPQSALTALQPALDVTPKNPLVSLELVDVYAMLGQAEAAVQIYEAGSPGMPSAAAAAAYLQRAEEQRQAGGMVAAVELWRKALAADPSNLYALLQLRDATHRAGGEAAAARYEDQLRYFDLRSVAIPSYAQLAEFQGRAMAQLVVAGIWTQETLHNVVAYQVWQFFAGEEGQCTEQVLRSLLEDRARDADLRFYLAELYHRRGEWEQAESGYRAVLKRDAAHAQAMLRLGMVYQAHGQLAEAADWYARYRALAPDDLLGLQRLVEVQEALGAPEAAVLREELIDRTDDRRIVARLLGIKPDEMQLEENLIQNGDFTDWVAGRPAWWWVSNMATGDPWNQGLFIGGREELDAPDGSAVRIQGLWLRHQTDRQPGRWGYWYFDERSRRIATLPLEPDGVYLISFDYRSDADEKQGAAVYVSDREEVLWRGDRHLPQTGSAWHHVVAIASNRTGVEAVMRLLLRHWGSGSVAFDRVRVARLGLPEEVRDALETVRFWNGSS